jgi:DNA polymerase-1
MSNPNRLYIGHNVSYDRTKMKQVGVNIDNVCDTMVAAHLCESEHLGLDYLLRGNTGHYLIKYSDLKRPLIDMSPQELCEYAGPHARAAWILWHGYEDDKYDWPGYKTELKRNLTWNVFWNLEMPLVPVLSDMEYNGVAVDANYLTELGAYFDEKIALLEEALKYWSGHTDVNFNSPDQVAKVFYDELEIKPPWRKTGSGRPAVEGKYLETIKNAHPIIPYYLRYKQLQKLKGTYVTGLLGQIVNGRVYGNFNQTGTRTSRLSSSNPNLQNIPIRAEEGRKIRRAFVAPEGYTLVKSDADQLELKMIAHLSKDPYMLQAFREGRDIHLETALRAFGDANKRSEAKTMNYQISYGGGEPEQQEAFFSAYPVVKKWTQKVHQEVQELGYVRTLFGRKRSLPEALSTYPKDREHGCREAVSTIVQGSSAEVIKIGMRRIWEDIKDTDVKTVLQVHDELVFQVPDNTVEDFMPCLKEKMQYDELEVPITHTISYGKTWADMKKWNGNNKE